MLLIPINLRQEVPILDLDALSKAQKNFFLSSLTDFHSLPVCAISTGGWAWSLAWLYLGVESIPSMLLSQLAGL